MALIIDGKKTIAPKKRIIRQIDCIEEYKQTAKNRALRCGFFVLFEIAKENRCVSFRAF